MEKLSANESIWFVPLNKAIPSSFNPCKKQLNYLNKTSFLEIHFKRFTKGFAEESKHLKYRKKGLASFADHGLSFASAPRQKASRPQSLSSLLHRVSDLRPKPTCYQGQVRFFVSKKVWRGVKSRSHMPLTENDTSLDEGDQVFAENEPKPEAMKPRCRCTFGLQAFILWAVLVLPPVIVTLCLLGLQLARETPDDLLKVGWRNNPMTAAPQWRH